MTDFHAPRKGLVKSLNVIITTADRYKNHVKNMDLHCSLPVLELFEGGPYMHVMMSWAFASPGG